MGDAIELRADGIVELAAMVAVNVDPERADAVEVAAAVDVDELVAFGARDDERLAGASSPASA